MNHALEECIGRTTNKENPMAVKKKVAVKKVPSKAAASQAQKAPVKKVAPKKSK